MNELISTQGDHFYQVEVEVTIHGYLVTECAWDLSGGLTLDREAGVFHLKRDAMRKANQLYRVYLKNTADL